MQRRPGFPARIDWRQPGAPTAAPPVGARREVQPPTPHGVGLDSAAVRARMVQQNWQAVLVPSSDPHLSEYLPDR